MIKGYVFEYEMSADLYGWLECLAKNGEGDVESLITEALWEYLSERVCIRKTDTNISIDEVM